jgi:Ca2+-binding RTX toxin-like protein
LAFTTVQGSGGAADSFVGTTGTDAIAIANNTGSFFLGGNQAADQIIVTNSGASSYTGVLSTATIKAGAGADVITIGNNANATIYTGLFVNGGADKDNIGAVATDTFIASTIQGGKANDKITTAILTSSLVNGNLGVDTISLAGAGSSATIYGGDGNDVITDGNVAFTNSLISGDKGNDSITLGNGGASIDGITVKGGTGVDTITLGDAGGTGNDKIFVAGNDGADTLTGSSVALKDITISGGQGADTITAGAGTTTSIGGLGNDTLQAGSGTNTFQYTDKAQTGVAASATSTAALGLADVIGSGTAFASTTDKIGFVTADALVGSSASVATGAANAWNLSTAGVFVSTGTLAYTAGTTSASTVATAIGTVKGDAGDVAYFAIEDSITGTQTLLFQLTLGTTRSSTAALNAGDTIALVADVTANDELVTGDFTFA